MTTLSLLYFASVREKIGLSGETVDIPDEAQSIADLIMWLRRRGPQYEAAFADEDKVRAAIDQQHANTNAPIKEAREVAFFPPVTGG
ncbi:MAG: molybdopterin converting factor subunit 1 [Pseudomonadota bacterium]